MSNDRAGDAFIGRMEGPAPAMDIAKDMARRTLWLAPLLILLGGLIAGTNGAASAVYGMAIVAANFLLAAWMLAAAGRISFALMAGAALFGYVLRLGLIFIAVLVVKDMAWVDLVALGITLIVTHLGLLFWELRYVSGSLAYPGLKPGRAPQLASDGTSGATSTASDIENKETSAC